MRTERQRWEEYESLTDPQDQQVWLLERLSSDVRDMRRIMVTFWWLWWIGLAMIIVGAAASSM